MNFKFSNNKHDFYNSINLNHDFYLPLKHVYTTHLQHTSDEEGDDTAGCLGERTRVGGFTDPYGVVLYLGQVKKGGHP